MHTKTKFKLHQVKCGLASSIQMVEAFVNFALNNDEASFGFDYETEGLNFPTDTAAGFSLYIDHPNPLAMYVPLNHYTVVDGVKVRHPYNLNPEEVYPILYKLLLVKRPVSHGFKFDGLHLFHGLLSQGFSKKDCTKVQTPIDTLIMGTATQGHSNALKLLGMESGLARMADTIELQTVIANTSDNDKFDGDTTRELTLNPEDFNFNVIDMSLHPIATSYAGQDAFLTYGLAPIIYDTLSNFTYVDRPAALDFFLDQQFESAMSLTLSSASGYPLNRARMISSVNSMGHSFIEHEAKIKDSIREIMGWPSPSKQDDQQPQLEIPE